MSMCRDHTYCNNSSAMMTQQQMHSVLKDASSNGKEGADRCACQCVCLSVSQSVSQGRCRTIEVR
jgi:hypothetical protein